MPVEDRGRQSVDKTNRGRPEGGVVAFRWFGRLSFASKCLMVGSALVALICVFFAEENWRGRRAWELCRHELQAKGVELDWQKFVPRPVPDEQNFAMTPFLAPLFDFTPKPREPGQSIWRDVEGHERAMKFTAELLPQGTSGQISTGLFDGRMTDLEGAVLLLRGRTNSTATGAAVFGTRQEAATALLAGLDEFRPVLEEIRAASKKRPSSRFNIEYDAEDPISIQLPHYLVLQRIVRMLQLRASAELELKDTAAAFDDVKLMEAVANSIRDEPFLIGVAVRGSLLKRTEQIIWEGVARGEWSEPQLGEIQTSFAGVNLVRDFKRGLDAERAAFGDTFFRYLRGHKNVLRGWVASYDSVGSMAYLLAGPGGWLDQEQVSYQHLQEWLLVGLDPDAERFHPREIETNRKFLDHAMGSSPMWHHTAFGKLVLGEVGKWFQRTAIGQNRANQMIVACALECYRLVNGKFPNDLSALAPAFIRSTPVDVCDGKPLKYRLLPNGCFLLYGVGWNEQDDGGLVVMNKDGSDIDPDQGDWVWPAYPDK